MSTTTVGDGSHPHHLIDSARMRPAEGLPVKLHTRTDHPRVRSARSVAPLAPVPLGEPTITGTPVAGRTLTAAPGAWLGKPSPTFVYVWERNGAPIPGAIGQDYLLVDADRSTQVRVLVAGINTIGTASAYSAAMKISSARDGRRSGLVLG